MVLDSIHKKGTNAMNIRKVNGETGQLAQSNNPLSKGYNRAVFFFKNYFCNKIVKKSVCSLKFIAW